MDPFRIHFDATQVDNLHARLDAVRLPSRTDNNSDHGISSGLLDQILREWRDYDWKPAEERLNSYDQYLGQLDGVDVHFFHIRSKTPNAPAILLCHGWPDSFLRYAKLFGEMPDFDLVVPSLPGFAFSALPDSGYANNYTVSELWLRLMRDVLGYNQFIVSGGDMGRGVACYLAANHPEAVRGLHLTDVGFVRELIARPDDELNTEELAYKHRALEWQRLEGAYINIQSTKPQTLSYSLADSPAGAAAWFGEKYHAWSDWPHFSMDDMLEALTLSWMTNTGGTCIRMYHGNTFDLPPLDIRNIKAPVGFTAFPKDILPAPRAWIEQNYPVVRYDEMDFGGHFTALENPEGFRTSLTAFADSLP